MLNKLQAKKSGFTLIEILIVVALIAILAVIALVALNPAEAQRKARDTQRIKDVGSLQGIIEQYVSDNLSSLTSAFTASSMGGAPLARAACNTSGWLGTAAQADFCRYANVLPVDPANRGIIVTNTSGGATTGTAQYYIIVDTQAQYRICSKLESRSNAAKLGADNGLSGDWFELYSATSVQTCP